LLVRGWSLRVEQDSTCKFAQMTLKSSGNFMGLARTHSQRDSASGVFLTLLFCNVHAGSHGTSRHIAEKDTRSPIADVRRAVCYCRGITRSVMLQTADSLLRSEAPASRLGLTNWPNKRAIRS